MWLKKLFPNYHHVECGLHSGFPVCCVIFYSFFWNPLLCNKRCLFIRRLWFALDTWLCKKRDVGNVQLIFFPEWNQTVEVKMPTMGRVLCPFCIFFTKKSGHIKCSCRHGKTGKVLEDQTKKILIYGETD